FGPRRPAALSLSSPLLLNLGAERLEGGEPAGVLAGPVVGGPSCVGGRGLPRQRAAVDVLRGDDPALAGGIAPRDDEAYGFEDRAVDAQVVLIGAFTRGQYSAQVPGRFGRVGDGLDQRGVHAVALGHQIVLDESP